MFLDRDHSHWRSSVLPQDQVGDFSSNRRFRVVTTTEQESSPSTFAQDVSHIPLTATR